MELRDFQNLVFKKANGECSLGQKNKKELNERQVLKKIKNSGKMVRENQVGKMDIEGVISSG